MKKAILATFIVVMMVFQIVSISALTSSEAREDWREARQESKQAQEAHRNAKLDIAIDRGSENEQDVIDTGKESMHAALDEVEAWLIWKRLEAQENPEVPSDIRNSIERDVESNLDKIEDLRTQVDGVQNRIEMGVVFLTMVGKYFELLADVSRNSGSMWVHIANKRADKIEEYEARLREVAEGMEDNEEVIAKLDTVKSELATARTNIDNAERAYDQIVYPGTPGVKFHEANGYLRSARANLITSAKNLRESYHMIVSLRQWKQKQLSGLL